MPSPTRKVQVKSAYKNNWRTRRNKQKNSTRRNVSPLHPSHKLKIKPKKPTGKFWDPNSNDEGHPDH